MHLNILQSKVFKDVSINLKVKFQPRLDLKSGETNVATVETSLFLMGCKDFGCKALLDRSCTCLG